MNSPAVSAKLFFGYTPQSQARAGRALRCAPFRLALFHQMQISSVLLPTIAAESGVQQGFSRWVLSENHTERELMWLIQVGLLRREVDGQGITDGFRLTPLAKQILAQYPADQVDFPSPTFGDRLKNQLLRWFLPLLRVLFR
jgi:hypothetical protein